LEIVTFACDGIAAAQSAMGTNQNRIEARMAAPQEFRRGI